MSIFSDNIRYESVQQTNLLLCKDQAPKKRKKLWLVTEMFGQSTNQWCN